VSAASKKSKIWISGAVQARAREIWCVSDLRRFDLHTMAIRFKLEIYLLSLGAFSCYPRHDVMRETFDFKLSPSARLMHSRLAIPFRTLLRLIELVTSIFLSFLCITPLTVVASINEADYIRSDITKTCRDETKHQKPAPSLPLQVFFLSLDAVGKPNSFLDHSLFILVLVRASNDRELGRKPGFLSTHHRTASQIKRHLSH
jgi:hypothetical protein